MLQNIKIDLESIEAMLYFWQATSEKDNISEMFFYDVAAMKGLKLCYDSEFNEESVRRVLSAIKNRELLSNATKKELRFWNNNMWMLEDLEYTNLMVSPVKKLNLDSLTPILKENFPNSKYETLEVIFAPLHVDEYLIKDNCLVINFFRVKPSDFDDTTSIGDKLIDDYILEKLTKLLNS